MKNVRCSELEAANERLVRDIRAREQSMGTLNEQLAILKSSGRGSPSVRVRNSVMFINHTNSQETHHIVFFSRT